MKYLCTECNLDGAFSRPIEYVLLCFPKWKISFCVRKNKVSKLNSWVLTPSKPLTSRICLFHSSRQKHAVTQCRNYDPTVRRGKSYPSYPRYNLSPGWHRGDRNKFLHRGAILRSPGDAVSILESVLYVRNHSRPNNFIRYGNFPPWRGDILLMFYCTVCSKLCN